MPLEYQTYLLATDLRTPEDVLAWFRVQPRYPFEGDLVLALAERLDRERRQACRRRALERWQTFAEAVSDYARQKRDEGLICDTGTEYYIEQYLAEALAFRAAARQP